MAGESTGYTLGMNGGESPTFYSVVTASANNIVKGEEVWARVSKLHVDVATIVFHHSVINSC